MRAETIILRARPQHELQYRAPSWKAEALFIIESLPILKYSGGGHVMHCSVGGRYKNKDWGTRQAISPASLQPR